MGFSGGNTQCQQCGLINPLLDKEDFVIRMIEETENKSNIWINMKTTTSQLLHQTHDEKKKDVPLKEQIPEEYQNSWTFLMKRKQTDFWKNKFGTTRSNWKTDLFLNPSKITIWHQLNKWNWINFWKKIWKKDTFNHWNPLWLPHFSLSLKKMQENYNHVKTINIWMNGQSRMLTHYHSSPK